MAATIEAERLYRAYINGARYVINSRKELNEINVFPVADGDTGNNLASAMNAIIDGSRIATSVKETLESMADACLQGARGNSGIIFAQYLNGLSEEIENAVSVTIEHFAEAHMRSVEYAYRAVSKPVEGTMLTVIREWASSMVHFKDRAGNLAELLSHSYKKLEESLRKTKNQLSVLKKAGVVDSGAKGFTLFVKGILDFIKNDRETEIKKFSLSEHMEHEDISHEDPLHRYCVETLIEGDFYRNEGLRSRLIELGDSLVVAGNRRLTRIHIHSDEPAQVFAVAEEFSRVIDKKVDDMKKQQDIENNRKFNIGLVTDSIADLPQEIIDEYQIHVVNLSIMIGDKEYYDKLTIDNSKLIKYYREGDEFPTSSQPSVKTVRSLFDDIKDRYDSVIAVTVASELSGTFNVFEKEAERLRAEGFKIEVIDSLQNSGSEGLMVLRAARMIEKKESHESIVSEIRGLASRSRILVSVRNLETMIKGGRLGTTSGRIAERMNLKPIVTLDEKGSGTIGGIAFSTEGTRKKLKKNFKKTAVKYGIEDYCIIYVQNPEEAEALGNELAEIAGFGPSFSMEASSVIAISAGEGALAVAYIRKEGI